MSVSTVSIIDPAATMRSGDNGYSTMKVFTIGREAPDAGYNHGYKTIGRIGKSDSGFSGDFKKPCKGFQSDRY